MTVFGWCRLVQSEKGYRSAAMAIARSEVLLPAEAGYMEPEGPMERTCRVSQDTVRGLVRVRTCLGGWGWGFLSGV
jgi:hypothetical protein